MLNFIFYQINRIFTSVCVHYCQFLMSMSKRVVKCILRARKLRVAPLCVLSYYSAFSHWENVQCAVWALRPVAGTVTVTTAPYDNNWTDRTVSLRTIETNECLRKITLKCTASVNCQTVIIKPDAHFFSAVVTIIRYYPDSLLYLIGLNTHSKHTWTTDIGLSVNGYLLNFSMSTLGITWFQTSVQW